MQISPFQNLLKKHIEGVLRTQVLKTEVPPQGMTSKVFFIKLKNNKDYAVKYGKDATNDVPALELIAKEKIEIPVPLLVKYFTFQDTPVVILEKIKYPLLETVPTQEIPRYIPSMVRNMQIMHRLKSDKAGLLIEPNSTKTWKEMMLAIFDGSTINWKEVAQREGLDRDLVVASVSNILEIIHNTEFQKDNFSFLHTDFNQRNLFIDPNGNEITGIIDWEEAMFGDPIYDLARIRMYIWHFNLGDKVVEDYYNLVGYTGEQKKLEELYWLTRIIQYLAWYSEELNDFNTSRIKLHQDFLRSYSWKD